jgi:hypothetical protein
MGGDVVDVQVLRRCKLGLKGRSSSWCRRHILLFAQDGLNALRPKGDSADSLQAAFSLCGKAG